jgi:DNA polymerase-3 subunit epsilon
MDFVALDFETANEHRTSACEVSLARVVNGKIQDRYTSLIKPHSSLAFNPWNVGIHGITPEQVENSPEFGAIAGDLLSFIGQSPLVAHNASFDMSVLRRTAELYDFELPVLTFYCTRLLSQRSPSLDLASYALANVCEALDIPFTETHRAEADTTACASIALSLAESADASGLQDLAARLQVRAGQLSSSRYIGLSSKGGTKAPSAFSKTTAQQFLESLGTDDMDFDDDFLGKEVIFTGTLSSMDRKVAQEKVLRAGGITGNGVTKGTSMVVVGAPYDSELKPGGTLSGKLQKVVDLRNKGANIRLVTEAEFLELFES